MENQLKVSLENIIPLTEARDHFSQIVAEVQKDKLYVLTKGGKPAVAIIDVKYLEHLTGGEIKKESINEEIKKAPEKVGLPPMIEHPKPAFSSSPPPIIPPASSPSAQPSTPPPLAPRPINPPPPPSSAPTSSPAKPLQMPVEDKPAAPFKSPPPVEPPKNQEVKPPAFTPSESPKSPPVQETSKIEIGGPPLPGSKPSPNKTANEKIDIQFAPEEQEPVKTDKNSQTKLAPDDQTPPAQYSGENDQSEVEDMPID